MKWTLFLYILSILFVSTHAKGLDKTEIKSIIKTYEEALEHRSYSKLDDVFFSLEGCSQYALFSYDVEQVKIKEIDGNNAYVKIRYSTGKSGREHEPLGWIQCTDRGKIKYDPLLVAHPIHQAFCVVSRYFDLLKNPHEYENIHTHVRYFDQLEKTGIPMFDIRRSSFSQREEKYREILRWLVENGNDWDVDEPIVPLPEEHFRTWVSSMKKYL